MCLVCYKERAPKLMEHIITDKEEMSKALNNKKCVVLKTFDNRNPHATQNQIDEIVENSLAIVWDAVDGNGFIFSIQWPNKYVPRFF